MQKAGIEVPEVQYNNVLRVTGLFLTLSTVSVLCWSNHLTASDIIVKRLGLGLGTWDLGPGT